MNRKFLLTFSLLAAPNFAHADEVKPTAPDLPALIECRAQLNDFRALAPALSDPLKAVALGWRPLPQTNQFMSEFELNTPIHVFGYDTDHIAFSGDGIVAVIDLPDPRPLVKQLQLETAFDTPQRAMFGKEVRGIEGVDTQTGTPTYESAVLTVSTVATHPGKTLAGCSYSLDAMDEDTKPAKSGD
jgi:hypothetical protein